jgi:hypothetical protein
VSALPLCSLSFRGILIIAASAPREILSKIFLSSLSGKIGHIDHPRSFLRDHAYPAAKDHPKLTSFFASFSS